MIKLYWNLLQVFTNKTFKKQKYYVLLLFIILYKIDLFLLDLYKNACGY